MNADTEFFWNAGKISRNHVFNIFCFTQILKSEDNLTSNLGVWWSTNAVMELHTAARAPRQPRPTFGPPAFREWGGVVWCGACSEGEAVGGHSLSGVVKAVGDNVCGFAEVCLCQPCHGWTEVKCSRDAEANDNKMKDLPGLSDVLAAPNVMFGHRKRTLQRWESGIGGGSQSCIFFRIFVSKGLVFFVKILGLCYIRPQTGIQSLLTVFQSGRA